MTRNKFRLGWGVAVLALAALACTCGGFSQLTEAGQQLQTAQAMATELATSGAVETLAAAATEIDLATPEAGGGGSVIVGNAPENIPVMDDPKNLISAEGSVIYSVTTDLDTAKKFYVAEMPANGWAEDQPAIEMAGTFVTLTYVKDTQQAVVTLTAQGGEVQVAIAVTPK